MSLTPTAPRVRTFIRLLAAVAAGALTLVLPATPGSAADAQRPSAANRLEVTAHNTGFRLAGTLHAGLATIHFVNAGSEPHALDLYRVTPGVTFDQFMADAASGDWDAFAADQADGGPGNGTPNIVSPGQDATVVGDGLQPGLYALVDGTPGLNGIANFLQGFALPVQVQDAATSAAAPSSDGDVLITDTAIHLPAAITTGHGTFSVHYQGDHEFQLVRLRPGATVQDAFTYWFARFSGQDPGGIPPAQFVGGLADLRPGVDGWVTLHLPPGTYGVWSIEDGDFTDILNGLTATFTVR